MAADFGIEGTAGSERKRKRKRTGNHVKLFLDKRVEVRSVEEGFMGSWHTATVIACENLVRLVKYDHLLCDDGSENLTESVNVSPMVDGASRSNSMPSDYRGLIRPLPPPFDFEKWCLHYGQCVDVLHQDAWWEGVIFDHEDGSDERKIFFPDMGDEMSTHLEMLRITQDWDEVTENWKPRGNWLFLQLIEEVEQHWPLPVSVKQIWYEVRIKNGFEKLKEWTSSLRDIWKELTLQVILDNFRLTIKEFFDKLNSAGDLLLESQLLKLSESSFDDLFQPKAYSESSLAVVPLKNSCHLEEHGLLPPDLNCTTSAAVEEELDQKDLASAMHSNLDMHLTASSFMPNHGAICVSPVSLSIIPSNSVGFSSFSFNNNSELSSASSKKDSGKPRPKRYMWNPVNHHMVLEAKFCPDAVTKYYNLSRLRRRPSGVLVSTARKHLLCLGWKIESVRDDKGIWRVRYTSPGGKRYHSLLLVCQDLTEHELPVASLIPQDDQRSLAAAPDGLISSPFNEQPPLYKEEPEELFSSEVIVIEPEYCPQAVVDYYSLGLEDKYAYHRLKGHCKAGDIPLKAKKHLSAVGWSFFQKPYKGRKEMWYISPSRRRYNSLRRACKRCIDEGGTSIRMEAITGGPATLTGFKRSLMSPVALSEKHQIESSNVSLSTKLSELGTVKAQRIRTLQKKRKNAELRHASHLLHTEDAESKLPKRWKESKALIPFQDDMAITGCVMQTRKKARKVLIPSSSHNNPRTVLSWLIDNNVVLPRAKVQYREGMDGCSMAEGRITRDGIKCSCCQKLFTLTNFEAHAGSKSQRQSANIFLEDGRSLLECQLQLKNNNDNKGRSRKELHHIKCSRPHKRNDHICSVCHYGGELILCDLCPSSFHISCLGLKDVPEGDWFCPSCCCGLCGQSGFNKDIEQFTDNGVLSCVQCEHQYHVGCLRKKGFLKLDNYPKGNWFCNRRCEEIFLGLHRLLGKPVAIENNLTWTLLKYTKSDRCDYDASDEALVEHYSKLNVALCVMHECFEPVKEPRTRRDLVEDVVFSRWSELNRLNFQGFYTVLLERNDELITVATVRVYGEKVAEVPLVGTRFQYRRLGMCRILMNELEKKLVELGVERLVLPAIPSVLNTWTTSFGFSAMTESERLTFMDYTFLDFQGTIMCQKLLVESPSLESNLPKGFEKEHCDDDNVNENFDLDGNSAVSEVFQAGQVEESEIVEQRSVKCCYWSSLHTSIAT